MGKHVMITGFFLLFGAALYVFSNREKSRPMNRLTSSKNAPRIMLEDFVVYKYENQKIISSLSGKSASFYDPSTLELIGDVICAEHSKEKNKSFSAESATLHFSSKGLSDLVKDSRIESAEVENQVRFNYDDLVVYTDYAKYLEREAILSSDFPVRIQNSKLDFMGSKGFVYSIKSHDLKVFGPLEGTLSADKR